MKSGARSSRGTTCARCQRRLSRRRCCWPSVAGGTDPDGCAPGLASQPVVPAARAPAAVDRRLPPATPAPAALLPWLAQHRPPLQQQLPQTPPPAAADWLPGQRWQPPVQPQRRQTQTGGYAPPPSRPSLRQGRGIWQDGRGAALQPQAEQGKSAATRCRAGIDECRQQRCGRTCNSRSPQAGAQQRGRQRLPPLKRRLQPALHRSHINHPGGGQPMAPRCLHLEHRRSRVSNDVDKSDICITHAGQPTPSSCRAWRGWEQPWRLTCALSPLKSSTGKEAAVSGLFAALLAPSPPLPFVLETSSIALLLLLPLPQTSRWKKSATSTILWSARCPLVPTSTLRLPATCPAGSVHCVCVRGMQLGIAGNIQAAAARFAACRGGRSAAGASPPRRAPQPAPRPRGSPAQSGSRRLRSVVAGRRQHSSGAGPGPGGARGSPVAATSTTVGCGSGYASARSSAGLPRTSRAVGVQALPQEAAYRGAHRPVILQPIQLLQHRVGHHQEHLRVVCVGGE